MTKKEQEKEEIDLREIAAVLWSRIIPILLTGTVFAALLFFYARFFVTPKYEANALFYVNNSTFSISNAVAITTGELSAASDLVDTYVEILQSRANMELVIEKSGVNYSYETLRKLISAEPLNSTGLFKITVTSTSPEEARTLANTIAAILPDKISDIVSNSSVEIVDYAVTPHARVSPSYIKYAAVGFLSGIAIAAVIAIISYLNDTIIHSEDFLMEHFQAPLLATIPDLTAKMPKKYGYYGEPKKKGGG